MHPFALVNPWKIFMYTRVHREHWFMSFVGLHHSAMFLFTLKPALSRRSCASLHVELAALQIKSCIHVQGNSHQILILFHRLKLFTSMQTLYKYVTRHPTLTYQCLSTGKLFYANVKVNKFINFQQRTTCGGRGSLPMMRRNLRLIFSSVFLEPLCSLNR